MLKNGLLIVFFLSCALFIKAQPQQPPVGNFTPRDYGDDHVPENYSICKDQRGFIYSGNIGGLLQYDGHEWQFIPIQNGVKIDVVTYIGNEQIACGGLKMIGLVKPDEKGKMKFHSLLHLIPDTLKEFEILTIQKSGKKIFFQSEQVIFIYENGKIKTVFPKNSFFRSYACDGRIFVRDRENGLMEWKNDSFQLFASDTLNKNYGFFGLVNWDEDHFLLAEHELGFFKLHKKTGEISSIPSFFYEDFLPRIFDLIQLDHHRFAIATSNHGVVILDKDLELKARISRNDGLKSSYINKITLDNSGNIWAATSGGISYIDINSPLHFYGENSGLPGNVEAVQTIGANYYAGSSSGLYLLPQAYTDDSKPWRKVEAINSQVNALDVNERDLIVASGNGLWAGTLNSYVLINSGNYQSVKFIPGINQIVALTPTHLDIFDNKYNLLQSFALDIYVQRSHSIAFDTSVNGRTRVWIGLTIQGVLRLDIEDSGEMKWERYDEVDGLMPGMVKPFNFIGKIIFLTESGFQHFISEEEVAKSLTEEQKEDPNFNRGFFDEFKIPGKSIKGRVSSMALDNGRIYLSLNGKLCYFDQKGKKHEKEFSTLHLGRINDLICFQNQLWIVASEGAAQFNPYHFKKIKHPFKTYFRKIQDKSDKIHMEEFFVNGNKFSVHQSDSEIPEIPYSANTITIRFSTDYFDHTNKMEYSYLIEGNEGKWSKWSKENKVTLNNLHEGDYVLHVKARNVYGVVSDEAVFRFHILAPWYRTWWAYLSYFLIAVVIVFIAIKVSVYRLKQSNLRLENIVHERTAEIANKNVELQTQNDQILHQKTEITDSINYARRIQDAILPVKKEIKRVFPDSFVLFKPKDIVSGDFYWFSHKDQHSIFICADCTGHGVPGAFMSMICTDRLNHTVLEKKITTPSEMLKEVNQGIKRSLKQEDESDLKTKDGMDAAVCSYDHATRILTYAGANRPLWLLRKGEIIEYKPTKMAVGGFTPEEQHFDEITITIEFGDIVYLSTDGYADQFGGPKGKKLMVKSFKELLLKNYSLPFDQQRDELDQFIENWRTHANENSSTIEQVDDMCVMGIRF